MRIRPIDTLDAEAFLDLSKAVDQTGMMLFEPREKKWTVEQQRKMIDGILGRRNSMTFVAEEYGRLIGYITAIGGNVKRTAHRAYIVVGVREEEQGRGIATELFNRLFNWAKSVDITRLELTVIKDNRKAFQLYQKLGFVLEGEKVHSLMIDGKPVNEYYLYKLLD
ncbi:GNAT family N-acetyltransferase [Halalkalibacterium halodurans]|jgi:RimJ/RimL family protein N-acetyltransferase|uniref:BH0426 protein n=1 Tax=Halalkalibacterium halodurans (strain ATCC BAA-125 / DSM 18197 / FERM 7344 / JCM 9153 / C-125) TaxID=272558 RepID=Q9KFQ2_HALH5|nr:GNAT family N-acetyltransferase [Halalkalibacterium halodurans]MDY7220928.1 GNAT family N-acetyltransferase [Halalkalibacterium halodurans]MDY7240167.1 GNAT family N-acetyltransferase [Halalkalibacterium halodurans]MED3646497.1 GNAT family N-acetyltransferase [Halalkalibacterium halodurans]MED4082526.1 GNAT family N-acetyltransferase [Halalkalibacterium halodurans]MED4085771.1 GNAT family N-acetyltransferase [Halalkalibacterium halodurans]